MNITPIPRSINSWDKLQYLIRCLTDITASKSNSCVKVLFYSPWDKASKKVRGHDCRVNLFEVPNAFHIICEAFSLDYKINYVPTLLNFYSSPSGHVIEMLDNTAAINYELTSNV